MPQIRIERFRASHGQEDGTEDDESSMSIAGEKKDCVHRIECPQHLRREQNCSDAEQCYRDKPKQCDRPEDFRHMPSAETLTSEERDQNDNRHWYDIWVE